jgi:hypothetical protein
MTQVTRDPQQSMTAATVSDVALVGLSGGLMCPECRQLWEQLVRSEKEHQLALGMLSISRERHVEKNLPALCAAVAMWGHRRDEAYKQYLEHQRQHEERPAKQE